MKYLKKFNESLVDKQFIVDTCKDYLADLKDNNYDISIVTEDICNYANKDIQDGIAIQIAITSNNQYEIFSYTNIKDDINRVISYLEDNNYILEYPVRAMSKSIMFPCNDLSCLGMVYMVGLIFEKK